MAVAHSDNTRARLETVADDTRKSGGEAWVLAIQTDPQQTDSFPALFDRSADYSAWLDELAQFDPLADDPRYPQATQKLRQTAWQPLLKRTISRILCNPRHANVSPALKLRGKPVSAPNPTSSGEPNGLQLADFQGKTWATRRDLWVDRLASAWLIRRFIDPQAQFCWLENIADCPTDALGFDFDGATFTHIGQPRHL